MHEISFGRNFIGNPLQSFRRSSRRSAPASVLVLLILGTCIHRLPRSCLKNVKFLHLKKIELLVGERMLLKAFSAQKVLLCGCVQTACLVVAMGSNEENRKMFYQNGEELQEIKDANAGKSVCKWCTALVVARDQHLMSKNCQEERLAKKKQLTAKLESETDEKENEKIKYELQEIESLEERIGKWFVNCPLCEEAFDKRNVARHVKDCCKKTWQGDKKEIAERLKKEVDEKGSAKAIREYLAEVAGGAVKVEESQAAKDNGGGAAVAEVVGGPEKVDEDVDTDHLSSDEAESQEGTKTPRMDDVEAESQKGTKTPLMDDVEEGRGQDADTEGSSDSECESTDAKKCRCGKKRKMASEETDIARRPEKSQKNEKSCDSDSESTAAKNCFCGGKETGKR